MSTLFEYDEQIYGLMKELDDDFNQEEIKEKLAVVSLERDKKIDNIACYIKEILNDIEGHKKIEAQQAEWRKQKEKKVEYFKSLLQYSLNGQKFESIANKITYRKSVAVNITDADKLPEDFIVIERKPDKKAIKEALEEGEIIDGAELVKKSNIQIK